MTENYILVHAYKSPWYMIFGSIIRFKTNSKINHVSIEIPESLNLDCSGIYESKSSNGVIRSKTHLRTPEYSYKMPFNYHTNNAKKAISYMEKSVKENYKYDFLGVLLGFFSFKIENPKKPFCSEYVNYIYFNLYLGIKDISSNLKTNLSPKVVISKCEAFLLGLDYANRS